MPKTLNRLVLNFPGFESTSPERQIGRLSYGGQKTAALWGFDFANGDITQEESAHKTVTSFETSSDNWRVTTRYVHFVWSDIIDKYEAVPYPLNLFRHLTAYLAFFFDRTVQKYFQTSARYWGFTIYPLLLMIVFAFISWFGAGYIFSYFDNAGFVQTVFAFLFFLVLCKYPGDRFYLSTSINDWAFARDMCRRSNPEIENRYEQFARELTSEIKTSDYDEIIIVGHSLGSVWAIMAVSRAISANASVLKGKTVTFLALGSSILKIGLVKKAKFLREAIKQVMAIKNLLWHEIQTKTDFISFYMADPFEPMDIADLDGEVIVHRVNFKHALSKERLYKMKWSMYVAHRQYILYCDKKVHHDFQLRVFGPFMAQDLARNTELAIGTQQTSQRDTTE